MSAPKMDSNPGGAPPVDLDLIGLYVMGQLDDHESARVEALAEAHPAWAAALAREAAVEMAMFEVVDHARVPELVTRLAEDRAEQVGALAAAGAWVRRWFALGGVALAGAAVVAVLVLARGPAVPDGSATYGLEVLTGESTLRSSAPAAQVPVYTRGSTLSLVLRPSTRVISAPQVAVTLDGQPLSGLSVERLDGGAIEISGVFSEQLREPTPGEHRLRVKVGEQELEQAFIWKGATP
jgi:anti-sigma factor RsiW